MKKFILLVLGLLFTSSSLYSQEEFEMKEGDTTYIMKKYYFCLLKRGPNKSLDSLQLKEIQKGHLAHINKLAKEGKIVLAGPFDGNFDARGILVFNTSSLEEAEKLQREDPAIKTGRLIMEIYPWWAAKGSKLP